ncbi:DUF58 domain-containing protein [Angustibacter sp. McL0619]|uniref:DUF58 domain-containing protein n=1 Tax=Angustibacter sp. McL0619 TaxID=3415676 RepID=UPI003CEA8326
MVTSAGWVIGAASATALAAGAAAGSPELMIIGLVGVAALLQALLWMLLRPELIAVRDIEPPRVPEAEPARALLLVRNQGRRRSPPILATERVGTSSVSVPVPSLAARETHHSTYPLPTERRGIYDVGPFTFGHTDPLRLLSASRSYTSRTQLVVHPHVHAVAPLPTGTNRDMEGPTSASSPRGGIAFHSIRPYERGDSLRDVHWKKSAQTGQLLVCHKVVPDEPSLMVVLDTCAASFEGDAFEDAVRVAVSLAVAGTSGGYPLQLRTTGGDVVVCEGRLGEADVLDLLAGVRTSADDPGLSSLAAISPGRATVSLGVVTGYPDPAVLSVVSQVRPSYLMASLIQVGAVRHSSFQLPQLQGVLSVSCMDSADFARQWNALVAA